MSKIPTDAPIMAVLRSREESDLFSSALSGMKIGNIVTFTSAQQALEVAQRQQFKVFLTRMEMPDMSGAVFIQKLRETGNYGEEAHLLLGDKIDTAALNIIYELDLAYVLTKPFNLDRISAKFAYLLQQENNLPAFELDYRAGKSALTNNLVEMAEDYAVRLTAAFPKIERAHVLLGDVGLKKEDLPLARRSFEQALELNKNFVPATQKLAHCFMLEKNYAKAAEMLNSLAAVSPHSIRLLENAGIANIESGQLEIAAGHLANLRKLDQSNKVAQEMRTEMALRSGDYNAVVTSVGATYGEKDAISQLNTAAVRLAQSNDPKRAIEMYQAALRQYGKSQYAYILHLNIGVAFRRLGDAQSARQHLEQSIKLKPDFAKARDALAALSGNVGTRPVQAVAG